MIELNGASVKCHGQFKAQKGGKSSLELLGFHRDIQGRRHQPTIFDPGNRELLMRKIAEERAKYQKLLNPTPQ